MKLLTLIAAATFAAPATAGPLYAYAIARDTCTLIRSGMALRDAQGAAMRTNWRTYGSDIIHDGSDVAARYIVAQMFDQCPEVLR